jgi:hypothetical protein
MYEFTDKYRQLLSDFYSPLEPTDGITEAILARSELRLGIELPAVLKDCYALTGGIRAVHHAYNHLLPPDALWTDDDVLVFYRENQNVVFWGLELASRERTDPPVLQAMNDVKLEWSREFGLLSDFLINQFYWQAVNGALPFGAIAEVDESVLTRIKGHWPQDNLMRGKNASGVTFYCKLSQILSISGEAPDYTLQVATGTKDDFESLDRFLQIRWSGSWSSD